MAPSKSNAVQTTEPAKHLIFDSDVPSISHRDSVFTRSLPKATQSMLRSAINDIKGVSFLQCRTRVWYIADGLEDNPYARLHFEFTANYGIGLGKVAAEMDTIARQREGEAAPTALG